MTFKRVFDRVCNITCQLPFAHQTLLYIGFTLKLHVLGVHVVSKSVKMTNRDPIHRACE